MDGFKNSKKKIYKMIYKSYRRHFLAIGEFPEEADTEEVLLPVMKRLAAEEVFIPDRVMFRYYRRIAPDLRKRLKMELARKDIFTNIKESYWDKRLKIRTCGRDASHADEDRFPYEPTPYSVLNRLAGSGYITEKSVLLDYGCGKGRVGLFLAYKTGCVSIGIEADAGIFNEAEKNRENAVSGRRVKLISGKAEDYNIPPKVNRIYFFNPFSIEILREVMERIRETFSRNPGRKQLLFYYPSDEYIAYLMTVEDLAFYDEIDCSDLFKGKDKRERILIFDWIAVSH